ncbi:MAG: sigma 54-interacting transcriptional regulator [Planctomycetota bacterium]|jgi:PAS domain S-box-containing protein
MKPVRPTTERPRIAPAGGRATLSLEHRSGELEKLYASAPVGLCLLDPGLRFVRINEHLAAIDGLPARDHIGLSVREVIPDLAPLVEEHLRQVLETGEPVLDAKVYGAMPADPSTIRCWRASHFPIKDARGTITGISVVVHEVTDLTQVREELQKRLEFERLVGDLSAELASLPAEEIDGAVQDGLGRLGRFFGTDRAQLSELGEDRELHVTHSWSAPGVEEVAAGAVWRALLPGAVRTLLRGQVFSFSSIDELTDEAFAVDRQAFEELGTKAHLSLPVEVGGEVLGVLTFGVLRGAHTWPPELVDRLRLVAQVFGNAMRRRDAERQLRSTLAEVQALKNRLDAESRYLAKEIVSGQYEEIVGNSGAMQQVVNQIEQVAPTHATALILGDTGTGKELVARILHRKSARSHRPLVKVNCTTLPSTLFESELFGHERGAFTGALKRRIGRFELAHGGTIFLDEVGDLPLDLQPKLLRVLQDGEFERLGSTETQRVDVRVIAATNRDLTVEVKNEKFRADLLYRLRVVPITLPPLRERREDVPLLIWHFVRRYAGQMGKTIQHIPHRLMTDFKEYDWPGNVRELANVIERAVILTAGKTLVVEEAFTSKPKAGAVQQERPGDDLKVVERDHIVEVLTRCDWKIKGRGNAAERLGISPNTLRARMKRLRIERPRDLS